MVISKILLYFIKIIVTGDNERAYKIKTYNIYQAIFQLTRKNIYILTAPDHQDNQL